MRDRYSSLPPLYLSDRFSSLPWETYSSLPWEAGTPVYHGGHNPVYRWYAAYGFTGKHRLYVHTWLLININRTTNDTGLLNTSSQKDYLAFRSGLIFSALKPRESKTYRHSQKLMIYHVVHYDSTNMSEHFMYILRTCICISMGVSRNLSMWERKREIGGREVGNVANVRRFSLR